MAELQGELQRLSGTSLEAAGAANVWAGTSGLELVGALNAKAGTSGLELGGVLRELGADLDEGDALDAVVNVLALDGTSGTCASTPDSAALSVTGDLEVWARVQLDDVAGVGFQAVVSKRESGVGNDYGVRFNNDGDPELVWFESSSAKTAISDTPIPAGDGETIWVGWTLDVDNGASGHDAKFYTATTDTNDWETAKAAASQLGSTITTAGTTSIDDTGAEVLIGHRLAGGLDELSGKVYAAAILDGIDGTVVANFNPAERGFNGGNTTLTDDQDNVWTLNGDAVWGVG